MSYTKGESVLDWKCHTPNLFKEILNNPGTGALSIPLQILLGMLGEVAQRAIELDDPKMNLLMLRLTLYSCANPLSKDYDPDAYEKAKAAIAEAKKT